MDKELIVDLLDVLAQHEVIPKSFAKKEKIKLEFKTMTDAGIKAKDAYKSLSFRYETSIKNIQNILYRNNKDAEDDSAAY